MKSLTTNEIRKTYLDFFESKGCLKLPSFSLIPENDPSILLINAGMTPMKKWFTGAETPPRRRVTTCQKCIRTLDIDQVGHTARHGTFFEMLGNFSFGDYFKKEVIPWAWELITEVFEMPAEKIYVTVYEDDQEAYDLWHDTVGLPADHISRFGKPDNFWEHGTGPCGPCSEIFFDRGEKYGCGKSTCAVGCDCDRYLEFWNLVFTQFDRQADGSYLPLEHKNIDTGGGLERFAMVLQGVDNFFQVDNIRAVLNHVADMAHIKYGENEKQDIALRVITDHIRSASMMISDGVMPGNEGRGYVLRRLLRRAARYGRLLNIPAPFLSELALLVINQSKEAYPELEARQKQILDTILHEEESFDQTIQQGLSLLEQDLQEARQAGQTVLSGDRVFRLHDTFGFPLDLTREIASEQGFTIDEEGFNAEMAQQKAKGREAQLKKAGSAWDKNALPETVDRSHPTRFTGYDTLFDQGKILALLATSDKGLVEKESLAVGEEGLALFDQTPFYGESGGQVGDQGFLHDGQFDSLSTNRNVARVTNTEKTGDGLYLHFVKVERGALHKGDQLNLSVEPTRRMSTARNHTTTHLLHKALRETLGQHVEQAGSLVTPDRLRFDFRHFKPMTPEEIRKVEDQVNRAILADYPVHTQVMNLEEAKQSGAMALFSEKYGDQVRVVSVGDFSRELCGGTHLSHSSQAGLFRILSENGVAAGVRRIEAVTGLGAYQEIQKEKDWLRESAAQLKTEPDQLSERIDGLLAERKKLEKEIKDIQAKKAGSQAEELLQKAKSIGSTQVILAEIQVADAESLREAGDRLKQSAKSTVVVLAAPVEGKVLWLAMASAAAVSSGVHCGNLIREAAKITGGGGGGRPDMAQAGGKDPSKIAPALEAVETLLKTQLQ